MASLKVVHRPGRTVTLEALPKKTTSTAQYAAVAVKTSCLFTFIKIKHEAEKATVNEKIVTTCALLLLFILETVVG